MNLYRVEDDSGSLWYNKDGEYTGKILEHGVLNALDYAMPHDPAHLGYRCAVGSVKEIGDYLGEIEFITLLRKGYDIVIYEAENYKPYNGYWLMCENTSKPIIRIGSQGVEYLR